MIRIYGYDRSSNVQKVAWCLDELGQPWDLVPTGGPHGGHKEDWYLALNPNGQIPTLDDGGFILWESNAILAYLAEKYGDGDLLPATTEGRASVRRWMDWQLAALTAPSARVMQLAIRTPPGARDPRSIEDAGAALATSWRRFEAAFGDGPFLAGAFSLADIAAGVFAHRWFRFPVDRPDLPRLRAWYDRLTEREAYRRHVMASLMPGEHG